jgi:hypothetical protein
MAETAKKHVYTKTNQFTDNESTYQLSFLAKA